MSNAFLGGVTISRSANVDPAVYSAISEVNSISGLGKVNPLVDVTSFDSAAREYIAGLADGQEITLECNYLPADTAQQAIITDVNAKTNFLFKVDVTDGTTPLSYEMLVVPLSWVIDPSYEDKNMLTFTLKISGDITVT